MYSFFYVTCVPAHGVHARSYVWLYMYLHVHVCPCRGHSIWLVIAPTATCTADSDHWSSVVNGHTMWCVFTYSACGTCTGMTYLLTGCLTSRCAYIVIVALSFLLTQPPLYHVVHRRSLCVDGVRQSLDALIQSLSQHQTHRSVPYRTWRPCEPCTGSDPQ